MSKVKEYLVDEEGPGEADYELIAGLEETELYAYNGLNQLVEVWKDEETYTYAYNTSGIRVSKTANDTETKFVLDGGNVIAELQDGTVTANYVRGMNLIYAEIDGSTCYYLYNAHGDVTDLTTTTGAVVKSYDYDAFGNEKTPTANDTNPFRYCGEYWDDETGTYYLRARYYDPSVGRFTAEDPIRAGSNWYAYANSSPIKYVDPLGLDAYIFYLPEWWYEAGLDKVSVMEAYDLSESEVHLVALNSAEDLRQAWNAMGTENGESVSIDIVIINTHGSPYGLSGFSDGSKVSSKDISSGANYYYKEDVGMVVLYGCNVGHLDYADSNPAAAFAKKVSGAPVLASDGTVYSRLLVELDTSSPLYSGGSLMSVLYGSKNDSSFRSYRQEGSTRDNAGWQMYQYVDGELQVTGTGSKKFTPVQMISWVHTHPIYFNPFGGIVKPQQ